MTMMEQKEPAGDGKPQGAQEDGQSKQTIAAEFLAELKKQAVEAPKDELKDGNESESKGGEGDPDPQVAELMERLKKSEAQQAVVNAKLNAVSEAYVGLLKDKNSGGAQGSGAAFSVDDMLKQHLRDNGTLFEQEQ